MAAKQQRQVDVWEKWNWLWNAIFYLTVVASVVLMLFVTPPKPPPGHGQP